MEIVGHGTALRLFGLLGLGALLAGCMTLTDEVPSPSASPEPTLQSRHPVQLAPPPEIIQLRPEAGETIAFQMSGYHGSGEGSYWLDKGETFVSWTCDGYGPFNVSFSDGTGFGARCEDFQVNQVSRKSFMTEVRHEVEIKIEARERQLWQVLVTQKPR